MANEMKMDIDPVGVFRLDPSSFNCVRGTDACCAITEKVGWEEVFDLFEDDKDRSSAIWGVDALELDYSFELLSEIYFDNPLTMGEGFAFVLQRESSNRLGESKLLGYGGIATAQPIVQFEGAPGKEDSHYQWKISMPNAVHTPSMHFPIDLAAGGAEFSFKYNEVIHEFKLFIDGEEVLVGEINLEEVMRHDEVIWGFTYSGESCVEQNINPMSVEVIDNDMDEALENSDEEEETPVKEVPESEDETPIKEVPESEDETPIKEVPESEDETPIKESPESEDETPIKESPESEDETPSKESPESEDGAPIVDPESEDEIPPVPVNWEDLGDEESGNETYESNMFLNELFDKDGPWSFVNNLFGAVGCPADQMLGLLGARVGRKGAKGMRVRLVDEPGPLKRRARTAAGYQHDFMLEQDVYNAQILLSFKTDMDKAFTDKDSGEVLVELDGVQHTAFECSGPKCTSEWQEIRINLGELKEGFHSLQIGSVLKCESGAVGEKARRFDTRVDNIRLKTVKPRGLDMATARKAALLKDLEKELSSTVEDGEEKLDIEAILNELRKLLGLTRGGAKRRGGNATEANRKGALMEKIQTKIDMDEDKEKALENNITLLKKKRMEALGEDHEDEMAELLDQLRKRLDTGGDVEDRTGELLDQLVERMNANDKREKELQTRLETRMKMHESKIENLSNNIDILEDAIDGIAGDSEEEGSKEMNVPPSTDTLDEMKTP